MCACMYVCIYVCMYVCMYRWMDFLDVWMDGRLHACIYISMYVEHNFVGFKVYNPPF